MHQFLSVCLLLDQRWLDNIIHLPFKEATDHAWWMAWYKAWVSKIAESIGVYRQVRSHLGVWSKVSGKSAIFCSLKIALPPSPISLSLVLIFPKHLSLVSIFSKSDWTPPPIFSELKIMDFPKTLDRIPNSCLDFGSTLADSHLDMWAQLSVPSVLIPALIDNIEWYPS